jgi:hypothetical protein
LSLLDFKAIQYRRKGNAVADEEHLTRIAKVPKREFMRRGINQHTLEKICKGEPVRAIKLAKCLRVLEEYELEKTRPVASEVKGWQTDRPIPEDLSYLANAGD